MKESLASSKELFLEKMSALFHQIQKASDPLHAFQLKTWDHFLELGLPEKKEEAFRYVALKKLYQESWQLKTDTNPLLTKEKVKEEVLAECQRSYIVFVDGMLRLDLSDMSALPKTVTIEPLADSFAVYGAYLQNRFSKILKEERNPFVALNAAFQNSQNGVFIFIPDKCSLDAPLQCVEMFTGSDTSYAFFPRYHIVLGKQAKACILLTESGSGKHFNQSVIDLSLEEEAKLEWITSFTTAQSISFHHMIAMLKKRADLKAINSASMGYLHRDSFRISLSGEEAVASVKSLSTLSGNQEQHTHILMEHIAPHTESMQHIKCVLDDRAKSSFEGKIYVQKEAQKTMAYQLHNTLLLSENAMINSKPNLEIMADDVKASHGATVAELSEDELFYLRTRGLAKKDAERLLLKGFCLDVASEISIDSLCLETIEKLEQMFEGLHVESPL